MNRVKVRTSGAVATVAEEGHPDYLRTFGLESAYSHLRLRDYRRVLVVATGNDPHEIWEQETKQGEPHENRSY